MHTWGPSRSVWLLAPALHLPGLVVLPGVGLSSPESELSFAAQGAPFRTAGLCHPTNLRGKLVNIMPGAASDSHPFSPSTPMAVLSNALNGLWAKTPMLSPSGAKLELPLMADEPLTAKLGDDESCELRIEGMTCAACVQVCQPSLGFGRL